jgi:hypothetical protein
VEDVAARHAQLFAEFPEPEVKQVSRLEREKKELANRSLVYGEIPFESVAAIFQLVRSATGRDMRLSRRLTVQWVAVGAFTR